MALSTELPELMPRKSPRALHAPSLPPAPYQINH